MTPTSSTTSSHDASREATGRLSEVSWCTVRDVVNPMAPASQGLGQLALHEGQVVVVGLLLEGPLAHGPGAQGRVPDVGREVDALGQAVDGVEVLGEGLEAPVDAGGQGGRVHVLGPLEVAHHQRPLVVMRTGARVKPQLPMTAEVTPCQHELEPVASQKTWASMWVWPSMKPGVTTWPSASISRPDRSLIRPTKPMRSSTTPTSARNDPSPDPSTTVPFRITMS